MSLMGLRVPVESLQENGLRYRLKLHSSDGILGRTDWSCNSADCDLGAQFRLDICSDSPHHRRRDSASHDNGVALCTWRFSARGDGAPAETSFYSEAAGNPASTDRRFWASADYLPEPLLSEVHPSRTVSVFVLHVPSVGCEHRGSPWYRTAYDGACCGADARADRSDGDGWNADGETQSNRCRSRSCISGALLGLLASSRARPGRCTSYVRHVLADCRSRGLVRSCCAVCGRAFHSADCFSVGEHLPARCGLHCHRFFFPHQGSLRAGSGADGDNRDGRTLLHCGSGSDCAE